MTYTFNKYKKYFLSNDWKSGISVFLVALPLCLGIALASGAPLFSGLVAGIIGGIVVGSLSGSHLSVSGPAAGLTIIVATAIKDLGSFQGFLVAVIIAGVCQVLFGYFKGGRLSAFFPNSVIKGMLVAIGIVIILKQIPHALGDDQDYIGEFEFEQVADNQNTITELIRSFIDFNYGAVIITITCLVVMIFWERMAKKKFKFFANIPSSLMAVLIGLGINEIYRLYYPTLFLGESSIHMVAVPILNSLEDFKNVIVLPDFSFLNNSKVYIIGITLAVVASLESLLNLEASDSMDVEKRVSSGDKELTAQGIGNIISGIFGGIPVTSVVVRSSANAYAGAKTRMSTIFHGILLLVSIIFIPRILNLVPLSALSAILLMIGYKLASPKIFKSVFKEGYSQFLPFLITILVVVFKDLLWGIAVGTLIGILFVLQTNFKNALTIVKDNKSVLIKLNKDIYFMNKSQVKQALTEVNDGDQVFIDGTNATFIDHDIYGIFNEFKKSASFRKIQVEYKNVFKNKSVEVKDLSEN